MFNRDYALDLATIYRSGKDLQVKEVLHDYLEDHGQECFIDKLFFQINHLEIEHQHISYYKIERVDVLAFGFTVNRKSPGNLFLKNIIAWFDDEERWVHGNLHLHQWQDGLISMSPFCFIDEDVYQTKTIKNYKGLLV